MKTHPDEDHVSRRDPPAADQADGDFRGPYGFGRRAYKPDPSANYVFEPGPPRVLPVEQRRRWRVPG